MEQASPDAPAEQQFGSMAHGWDRMLRGEAYFPDTGCSPQDISMDPVVYCDGRARCLVCPGGLGPGGKGYKKSRDVPCADPARHMGVFQVVLAQQFYLDGCAPTRLCPTMLRRKPRDGDAIDTIEDALGLYQPGISTSRILPRLQGVFCSKCNYTGGKGTHSLARHVLDDTRDLERTGRQRGQRAGTPIIWCDKKWRCLECNPRGATRARNVGCTNLTEHQPTYDAGFRGESRVHFVTADGKSDLGRDLLLLGLDSGCTDCRVALKRALSQREDMA